jgi:exonuclease SbcD
VNELKILHTSDWHLGLESWTGSKTVDRLAETENTLRFLVTAAKKESVDLIIITGDVVHNKISPKIEALNVLTNILAEFSSLAPTFLVLGNHDWRGIKALKNLPVKNLHIIDSRTEISSGEFKLFFLPYLDFQKTLDESNDFAGDYLSSVFTDIRNNIEREKINLLAAHIMIEGLIESERENSMEVQIKASMIPTGLDYVALGHIHALSIVEQSPLMCYAGSPIAMDFGEEKDRKGAIIVDFSGERTKIRIVDTPRKQLKTFRKTDYSEQSLESLSNELKSFEGYARVIFNAPPSNEVRKYLMENFECVKKVEFRNEHEKGGYQNLNQQKFDIIQLYQAYIKGKYGNLEQSMVKLVEKLFREVEQTEATDN